MAPAIQIDRDRLAAFCSRWRIAELSLFGSVLRADFGPDSDVDVLVRLADDAEWSLGDWVDMIAELGVLLGREVDVVEESRLKNPFRRPSVIGPGFGLGARCRTRSRSSVSVTASRRGSDAQWRRSRSRRAATARASRSGPSGSAWVQVTASSA